MNHSPIEQIAENWKLAASPVRPGHLVVDFFRRALPSGTGWSGLVQGATPEAIDLMVSRGAERIVSMDLHLETMEAMRTLAKEDWSRVKTVVGDWTEDKPDFRGAFDIVISDGGPHFLPFPAGWTQLFENTHRQLAPGGKAVVRMWVEPKGFPPFREYFEDAVNRFEEERRDRTEDEQKSMFIEFVSEAKSACLVGSVDPDGRIVEERMWPAFQLLEEDLRAKYGSGPLEAVVSALFDRTNPVGEDGAHLTSAPGQDLFRPVLEDAGFSVDVTVLDETHLPSWTLVVTATKV
ncbi:MAG: class I SAM-dependent methyltransferase [Gemmatimonadetes bacterium]|nr:class I SAM-dependent methyltransferase [Gemmatimonadota bacterium]